VTPATWPLADPAAARLLVVDAAKTATVQQTRQLPHWLSAGDLLVVNDAATLPGSLTAHTASCDPIEIRLVRAVTDTLWAALVFGPGDWRSDTDDRPQPVALAPGDTLTVAADLTATIVAVTAASPRLVTLTFDHTGADFWAALYRYGQPIQYRHVAGPLPLWHVQTRFASRPWAVEMPSAGFVLTWDLLLDLRRHGVHLATVTHAAGLSATGDTGLDVSLPWIERYDVPAETVEAIARTKHAGRRVIAAGTSVVRALEGSAAAHGGHLVAGEGETAYRLGTGTALHLVDGLLTGMHAPTASHYQLLQAFASLPVLQAAYETAAAAGFHGHEFGDACLILRPAAVRPAPPIRRAGGAIPV
jgi:S-adenosylmethionine:tRNA ribosyltransferase-isomerase